MERKVKVVKTFNLDLELFEEAKDYAFNNKLSFSEFIRIAVKNLLKGDN